LLDIVW